MKKYINLSSRQTGFTLIEALLVIVVLGILTTLAANYYDEQKRRGYRTDAINAILKVAQLQERNKTVTGIYDDLATISADDFLGAGNLTEQGKYIISLPVQTNSTYTITAAATGGQLDDTDCRSFSLTHTGIRSSTNSGGATTTGAASRCWPR